MAFRATTRAALYNGNRFGCKQASVNERRLSSCLGKAGIPRRRHGHRHRHPRDDPRADVGEGVSVSGDFPVQLAAGISSGNRSRVSDVSARIIAMIVGVGVGVVECELNRASSTN